MSIKVCYVAGREATYSRTHNVIKALRRAGFEVDACVPPDRKKIHQPKLLWEFMRKKRGADVVVLGFYGQLLMPFVRMLTRKPILFDVYVSTYGTMVDDRGEASARSLQAMVFWLADHLSMRLSTHMILETRHHIRRYAEMYRVPASKFTRVFLPSDEDLIFRRDPRPNDGRFRVHFHGEYAPFHGVDIVLRAAKALENFSVDFQIIGTGITYERDRKLAAELGISNVEFIDRVPYEKLGEYMSRADVCLGFFSGNARADRLLTNKVVEAMAVGKPLITRRNAAVQELLEDGESVLLVEPDDPDALAAAILRLKKEPALAEKLGRNALQRFREQCAHPVFSRQLKDIVEGLVNGHASLPEPAPGDHA